MRVPAPRDRRVSCLVLLACCVSLAAGCATRVKVDGDARVDFASVRTWAWDERGPQLDVDDASPKLQARVVEIVEEALAARGYQRVAHHPDFLVSVAASVHTRVRSVRVPMAPYLFDSYHASQSYWIEGTTVERRVYRDLRLGIALRRSDGGAEWRGVAAELVDGVHGLPTERLVDTLVGELPTASGGGGTPTRWDAERLAGVAP